MIRILVEKNITLYSTCEHHLLPIVGKAHVAYISKGTVVGLSKMNRIVQYYAQRPQVQERLTIQIVEELKQVLGTEDVACVIDAKHLCVNSRGIRDIESSTVTAEFGGKFKEDKTKRELLYRQVKSLQKVTEKEYIPNIIFEENYVLDTGKVISRIYVKSNQNFNIYDKNSWDIAFEFFNEKIPSYHAKKKLPF